MFSLSRAILLAAYVSRCHGFGNLCGRNGADIPIPANMTTLTAPVANLKVAMFGDQGKGSGTSYPNMKMIYDWIDGSEDAFVIHAGDFDYGSSPSAWQALIDETLPDVPYFATIGNHDTSSWTGSSGYAARLDERAAKTGTDQYCTGDTAVNQYCSYKGLDFVLSGVGTRGSGHTQFIANSLRTSQSSMKMCVWHKNQRLFQVGGKSDEVGYEAYEECRRYGAIVNTGHEHSYSRTHTMTSMSSRPVVADSNNDVVIDDSKGESFLFVSGLGGQSIRSYDTKGTNNYPGPLKDNDWWASHAASNDGVSDGVLFCIFNPGGSRPNEADCEFKDRKGKVWDTFTITSKNSNKGPAPKDPCVPTWLEFPIAKSEDDLVASAGHLQTELPLSSNSTVQLTFRDVRIPPGPVGTVYLELYGLSPSTEDDSADITISGVHGGPTVHWSTADEGFEHHEVWVTPNLVEIVQHARQQPSWDGTVTFSMHGEGLVKRSVYSFDADRCLAPTLTIGMARTC